MGVQSLHIDDVLGGGGQWRLAVVVVMNHRTLEAAGQCTECSVHIDCASLHQTIQIKTEGLALAALEIFTQIGASRLTRIDDVLLVVEALDIGRDHIT